MTIQIEKAGTNDITSIVTHLWLAKGLVYCESAEIKLQDIYQIFLMDIKRFTPPPDAFIKRQISRTLFYKIVKEAAQLGDFGWPSAYSLEMLQKQIAHSPPEPIRRIYGRGYYNLYFDRSRLYQKEFPMLFREDRQKILMEQMETIKATNFFLSLNSD
jgi:hypothetical protein